MENQLEKLISDYFKKEHHFHRAEIFIFQKKISDANDLIEALSQELGFKAVKEKIESFKQFKVDSLIYNYDKRGWLYIALPTRRLYFIDASKKPYPQDLVDKQKLAHKVKYWTAFSFVLFLLMCFLFLLIFLFLIC